MRKYNNQKKVVVAMSPKQSLRDATGQAGGAQEKKKVVVAMSGGLDSSVAAALLKRAGPAPEHPSSRAEHTTGQGARYGVNFDVIGVFMKFWMASEENGLIGVWNRCCSPEAEARARKVAKILKIPFYVFNFEKEFKKRIVDYFLAGYKNGITPNPCVVCNKEIKFGLLLEKALALDADFIATGHYARKIQNPKSKIQTLLRARDKNKDQSYFLWMLNQEQLKKTLFPIGNYTRKEVENLAKKFKLPVLGIKKSVEICFVQTASPPVGGRGGRRDFSLRPTINDFLKKYLKEEIGKIVDTQGKVVGQHRGLWFYTIGQRKGLGLTGGPAFAEASAGKPYYVLDKNLKENLLIVTKNEKDYNPPTTLQGKIIDYNPPTTLQGKIIDYNPPTTRQGKTYSLYKKELIVKNINWISGEIPKLPLKVKAKIRYRHQPAPATITKTLNPNTHTLKFKRPQRAITPGQSVVFYQGQELLGGGIIG